MKHPIKVARSLATVLGLLAIFATCPVARAVNNVWVGPNLGSWNVDPNWSLGAGAFVPDASFNEAALINNGTTPLLNTGLIPNVGGLKLGISGIDPVGDAEVGGLRIES